MFKKNLPKKVNVIEVGPRDGFQFEPTIIPTELKVQIIEDLVGAGISHIQVTSFVNPKKVPQMADAEKLVRLLPKKEHVIYSGLVLNAKGVERAAAAGISHVEISISASDTHGLKNAGMSFSQAFSQAKEMISLAKSFHQTIRASVQCSFGCAFEGEVDTRRVIQIVEQYLEHGVDAVCLSDTTGMATPLKLEYLLGKVIPMAKQIPAMLHLHDTRGLGLVNVMTALLNGVTYFDTSLGGMGGCPFVPNASGNIATEDTVYLLESLGIETGIDKTKVAKCSIRLEHFLNKRFSGKFQHEYLLRHSGEGISPVRHQA
ncbi:MAG: hydroxymethylglutaryl-CoA lyase [Desulfobacterales bacterium]|nr:hydroxymethylglutaryl-CoA lyase [Desulfobacterales bacterium]